VLLIGAGLAAVLAAPRRWPRAHPVLIAWCATAAALILFFTLAPVQVLITIYAAGLLAVTARRSPITPATLAISTATGAAGGLLMVALWNPLRTRGPSTANVVRAGLLFALLVGLAAVVTTAVVVVLERRARGTNDPLAPKARMWQCLAAGPLTAASAALMLPLFRDSHAVRVAATCPVTQHFHCTAAPSLWMFFLVAGPILGLAMASTAAITAAQPPSQPPRRPPPPEPPSEPRPDGSRSGGVFVKI
jgi:hypothetical protein